jgi:arylsulfatase A-like enzyme
MPPLAPLYAAILSSILLACGSGGPGFEQRPNVLLILIDTLRKDHLHLHGYERKTSDTIDALAAEGWVFENHIASASQTVPSTLSMLLSQHPAEHGFVHLGPGQFRRHRPRYPEEFLFLAEVFRDAGYATAGYVGNSFLKRENGFAQGSGTFLYSEGRAETLTKPSLRWLGERASEPERPFFLYIHYFDVHWPYEPPPAYRNRFSRPEGGQPVYNNGPFPGAKPEDVVATISLYDCGIVFIDDEIARIPGALERLGLRDGTVIVVTSDHGDEFLEHGGLGHGTTVYGELIRAPLILVYAKQLPPGRRVAYLTPHVDLAPTLLELSGIDKPPEFRGLTLFEPARRAFAENGPWVAVYSEDRNLVFNRQTGEIKIFEANDELDQRPLPEAAGQTTLLKHLEWYRRLSRDPQVPTAGAVPPWSQEELNRLRALGYVD